MTTYTAEATPSDIPGSGWYETLPPPGPARELDGEITADWAIVGAGFAGLAAARRLAQLFPGDRIVVLDAQRVGFGAAGRNSGFMIDLPHDLSSEAYAGGLERDRQQIAMNRSAIDFAQEAVEDYGLQAYFAPSGKVHGASNQRGLKLLDQFESHLTCLDEVCHRLDRADMKRITGTDYYIGGLSCPGTAMLQPAGYVRGLAKGLSTKVVIYENSPVIKIDTGAAHELHTPKGRVQVRNIILTVNGHLESFGLFERQLMHLYTFASMTKEMSDKEITVLGGEPEWALIPADPMGTTVRRTKDNRIVIRNCFTYNPDLRSSEAQVKKVGHGHDLSFRARFPMLSSLEMEYRWGGLLCASLNGVPAFGEIEERVFVAGCQNGLGVCKGTLHGKLIAELAAGQDSPYIRAAQSFEQPKRLPPDPFMTIGARAHLWWAQERAGSDL